MFGVKCFMHVGVVQFWNRYGQTLEDRAQVDEASICGQRHVRMYERMCVR